MLWRELAPYFPDSLREKLLEEANPLAEIRLRANQRTQLVYLGGGDAFAGETIGVERLRRIALAMMEHSYHAYEHELSSGFFTMKNGCRVGVGGSFAVTDSGKFRLKDISSLCIRIAGDVIGCAGKMVTAFLDGGMKNTLVLSPPGQGKTTLLRDAARILATNGFRVGIADERHEIAACVNGAAQFDLGPRCDIIDGCPKARGMEMLIRSLNPQIIITDEIGGVRDGYAIREAARMGVAVIASAHASDIDEFRNGKPGALLEEGIFRMAVLLGNPPGKISRIWRYGEA